MENKTRLERWLDRSLARAETPRGGAAVIATITTIATLGAGLLMTVVDHRNFTTVGQGLWWAVQQLPPWVMAMSSRPTPSGNSWPRP